MSEVKTSPYGKIKDAGDLNAGAVTTDYFDCRTWHSACFDFELDNSGGVTSLAITFLHKRARGATTYKVPNNQADGTSAPLTLTWTVANGLVWSEPINVADYDEVAAVITPTGAGAGDLISVWVNRTND